MPVNDLDNEPAQPQTEWERYCRTPHMRAADFNLRFVQPRREMLVGGRRVVSVQKRRIRREWEMVVAGARTNRMRARYFRYPTSNARRTGLAPSRSRGRPKSQPARMPGVRSDLRRHRPTPALLQPPMLRPLASPSLSRHTQTQASKAHAQRHRQGQKESDTDAWTGKPECPGMVRPSEQVSRVRAAKAPRRQAWKV